MLNQVEISKLGPGFHPNSELRRIFGSKHGTIVEARAGNEISGPYDTKFVGNRAQKRFRRRNPMGSLDAERRRWMQRWKRRREDQFQDSAMDNKVSMIKRAMKFLRSVMKALFFRDK